MFNCSNRYHCQLCVFCLCACNRVISCQSDKFAFQSLLKRNMWIRTAQNVLWYIVSSTEYATDKYQHYMLWQILFTCSRVHGYDSTTVQCTCMLSDHFAQEPHTNVYTFTHRHVHNYRLHFISCFLTSWSTCWILCNSCLSRRWLAMTVDTEATMLCLSEADDSRVAVCSPMTAINWWQKQSI